MAQCGEAKPDLWAGMDKTGRLGALGGFSPAVAASRAPLALLSECSSQVVAAFFNVALLVVHLLHGVLVGVGGARLAAASRALQGARLRVDRVFFASSMLLVPPLVVPCVFGGSTLGGLSLVPSLASLCALLCALSLLLVTLLCANKLWPGRRDARSPGLLRSCSPSAPDAARGGSG